MDYAEGQHAGRRSQDVNRTGKEREEWGRGRSVTSKSEIGLKRKWPQWKREVKTVVVFVESQTVIDSQVY